MSRVDARPREPSLRVVLLLKTCEGGLWAVAQVEELRLRGHSVVAVLPAGTGRLRTALVGRGVAVHDSAFDFGFRRPWRALRGLLRLRRQITELAPDVVHYHLYASALAARLATLGTGVPRVHMVAGPLYLESPLIRAAERLLVRLDTVTVAGSAHTAALYRGLGVPSDRASTVPYGVDVDEFSPPCAATRAAARA
ncbi:MAG TPA: glycosyltransferase, partial [Cryptosporangiaceae bacterium]|nr:glycosyltransferase [Cryptosporangiaceae bacterium]